MQLDTFTEISRAVPAFAVVSSAKVSVFSGSAAPSKLFFNTAFV